MTPYNHTPTVVDRSHIFLHVQPCSPLEFGFCWPWSNLAMLLKVIHSPIGFRNRRKCNYYIITWEPFMTVVCRYSTIVDLLALVISSRLRPQRMVHSWQHGSCVPAASGVPVDLRKDLGPSRQRVHLGDHHQHQGLGMVETVKDGW